MRLTTRWSVDAAHREENEAMNKDQARARADHAADDLVTTATAAAKLGVSSGEVAEGIVRGYSALPEVVRGGIGDRLLAGLSSEAKRKALVELLAGFSDEERGAILASISDPSVDAVPAPTAP